MVQCGWFLFKIMQGQNGLDLLTLDFKNIASFTNDFQIAEQVHWAQQETLRRLGTSALGCTLRSPATVSRFYRPGALNAYLERREPISEEDSGWHVGIINEPLDLNDEASFLYQSLYELTILDERLARFWLLPVGYRIYFEGDEPRIERLR